MKTHPFHIHVPRAPVDLWDKLRKLAAREQHLLKVEALNAIIGHLKAKKMLRDKEFAQIDAAREEG
jgi:hypothetical protein